MGTTILALAQYTINMLIGWGLIGILIIVAIVAAVIFMLGIRQDKEYKQEALPDQAVIMQIEDADRAMSNSLNGISSKDLKKAVKKEKLKNSDVRTRNQYEAGKRAASLPVPKIISGNDYSGGQANNTNDASLPAFTEASTGDIAPVSLDIDELNDYPSPTTDSNDGDALPNIDPSVVDLPMSYDDQMEADDTTPANGNQSEALPLPSFAGGAPQAPQPDTRPSPSLPNFNNLAGNGRQGANDALDAINGLMGRSDAGKTADPVKMRNPFG